MSHSSIDGIIIMAFIFGAGFVMMLCIVVLFALAQYWLNKRP